MGLFPVMIYYNLGLRCNKSCIHCMSCWSPLLLVDHSARSIWTIVNHTRNIWAYTDFQFDAHFLIALNQSERELNNYLRNRTWQYFYKSSFRWLRKEQFVIQAFCYPMKNQPIQDHWIHYKSPRLKYNINLVLNNIYYNNNN